MTGSPSTLEAASAASATPSDDTQASRLVTRALRDALLGVLIVAVCGASFVALDAVEFIAPFIARREAAELDDLLLGACFAVLVTCWFAMRRFGDAAKQLNELRVLEQERAAAVAQLEMLSTQLSSAEQQAREHVADVLHDSVAQSLYACRLKLDLLSPSADSTESTLLLAQAKALLDAAMRDTRDLTLDMSPACELGMTVALQGAVLRLGERYHVAIELMPSDVWERVPSTMCDPLFASIQELVVNACKHARASRIQVSARREAQSVEPGVNADFIIAQVSDDGCGFDLQRARAGFGLLRTQRRLSAVAATLEIESTPASGTRGRVRIRVP